jgi:hypothetical protein
MEWLNIGGLSVLKSRETLLRNNACTIFSMQCFLRELNFWSTPLYL